MNSQQEQVYTSVTQLLFQQYQAVTGRLPNQEASARLENVVKEALEIPKVTGERLGEGFYVVVLGRLAEAGARLDLGNGDVPNSYIDEQLAQLAGRLYQMPDHKWAVRNS